MLRYADVGVAAAGSGAMVTLHYAVLNEVLKSAPLTRFCPNPDRTPHSWAATAKQGRHLPLGRLGFLVVLTNN